MADISLTSSNGTPENLKYSVSLIFLFIETTVLYSTVSMYVDNSVGIVDLLEVLYHLIRSCTMGLFLEVSRMYSEAIEYALLSKLASHIPEITIQTSSMPSLNISSGSTEKCIIEDRIKTVDKTPTGSLENKEIALNASLAEGRSPLHMLISSIDS